MKNGIFCVLLVASVVIQISFGHNLPRLRFTRKTCAPAESCLTSGFGVTLGLCDCPGGNPECPTDDPRSTVISAGYTYNFCQPTQLLDCNQGDISTTVQNLSMRMYCLCPESLQFVSKRIDNPTDNTLLEYVCGRRRICEPDERCQAVMYGGKVTMCHCAAGSSCRSLGENPLVASPGVCM